MRHDTPLLPPPGPPQVEQAPPPEHGVFQSPSILFVLLRICIFTVLAIGISFALQWILVTLSPGDRSPYSPINLAISEACSLAGGRWPRPSPLLPGICPPSRGRLVLPPTGFATVC